MTTVHQLLHTKGHGFWSVTPDDTVYEAIRVMAEKDVGALLVMDGDAFVGMITERHYARDIALKGRASPQTPVRAVMETDAICTHLAQTIDECMHLMTEHRVRHMPVIDDEKVVGIVSIGDVVKSIIDDQKHTIDHLQSYIHGEQSVGCSLAQN